MQTCTPIHTSHTHTHTHTHTQEKALLYLIMTPEVNLWPSHENNLSWDTDS